MLPRHVLFDLNGTRFDPSVIAEPLPTEADRSRFAEAVLSDAVLLGTVETITGTFRDFAKLLEAAAECQLNLIGAARALDAVIEASRRMRPFPEAGEAIATLRRSGIGVGVLTNSSTATARSLLSAAGLELEPVVGADEVEAFKPDPRVYRRGVEATGREAREALLVTAHWWDALGAKRGGLKAAWISGNEGVRMDVEPPPDYEAQDLVELARIVSA